MSDTPPSNTGSKLVRDDSKRKLTVGEGDAGRRSRFKERSRDLERGTSAPSLQTQYSPGPSRAPLPFSEEEARTIGETMGHEFEKKTFYQPTYCHHCSELLWGIRGQGFHCKGESGRRRGWVSLWRKWRLTSL